MLSPDNMLVSACSEQFLMLCIASHHIWHLIFQYFCFKENFAIFSFILPFMKIESVCTEFNIVTEVLVKYSSKSDDLDIAV